MKKQPCVYILASKPNGTLYTGVTSHLQQRVQQHKDAKTEGFSQRYACKYLVFFYYFETMYEAICFEKRLKGGSRQQKIDLIIETNPDWTDLSKLL